MDLNMVKYIELNEHVTTKIMWNFVNNWSSDSSEMSVVLFGHGFDVGAVISFKL